MHISLSLSIYIYIYCTHSTIKHRRLGGAPRAAPLNRAIVSFRSCVRAGEADSVSWPKLGPLRAAAAARPGPWRLAWLLAWPVGPA